MNYISELALDYLQLYQYPSFSNYGSILREACQIHPPPHGKAWYGTLYRRHALSHRWFSQSLVLNAKEEGQGSRNVWELSQHIANQEFAALVRSHSIDESRHSKMFVTLCNILFPSKIEAKEREKLKTLSPGYSKHYHPPTNLASSEEILEESEVIDELIKINLLEIRALVLQLLLRPVLRAYGEPKDVAKVTRMSDQFIEDETRHIAYSAYCIEKYVEQGNRAWVRERLIQHQKFTNQFCLEGIELEGA